MYQLCYIFLYIPYETLHSKTRDIHNYHILYKMTDIKFFTSYVLLTLHNNIIYNVCATTLYFSISKHLCNCVINKLNNIALSCINLKNDRNLRMDDTQGMNKTGVKIKGDEFKFLRHVLMIILINSFSIGLNNFIYSNIYNIISKGSNKLNSLQTI